MQTKVVSKLARKLYIEIEEEGIDRIRELFSKGETLSQELKFYANEEYLKKMIMSQLNIGRMLMSHKYRNSGFDERTAFNNEADKIRRQIDSQEVLKFDNPTLEALFGNSLNISTEQEYEEWKEFVDSDRHKEKKFDTIYLEEEARFSYENETNPLKKIIKSFRYRKMLKEGTLEDSYVKKVREMIREKITENPEDHSIAYRDTHSALEKGAEEYESIKDIEDIARMTLESLSVKDDKPINIEEVCNNVRSKMKSTIGSTKNGTEYRKKQVTLGSESGISNRPVIHTIQFEEVPEAIKNLQIEYEKAYNSSQPEEEYIKQIAKIYADFIFIQPYEDGNKRTAMCVFNSMLMSKGIVPPPISLINDDQMVKAYYNAYEKDYEMLQNVVTEKYRETKSIPDNNNNKQEEMESNYNKEFEK